MVWNLLFHCRLPGPRIKMVYNCTVFDSTATIEEMQGFVYDQPATRVIFGVGTLERLAQEVKRLGAKRALVLADRAAAGLLTA